MDRPDVVAINYSRDVGWAGALTIELCREEPSTLEVTFSHDGKSEIGVWQQKLPRSDFAQALNLVQRSGYATIAGPAEVSPEARFVSIGERTAGAKLPSLRAFELAALPPVVGALGAEIERLAAPLRAHPLRVIHAAAAWAKPAFEAGEPLAIEMVMGNSGRAPLEMGNPLDAMAEGWNGLRLVIRDAGGTEQIADLTAANVRARPAASTGGTATLDPGMGLPFRIRKKVYLTPGRYAGRVEYHGLVDNPQNRQRVTGALWLDLGPFEIRPGKSSP
jgi:hypothetical protein